MTASSSGAELRDRIVLSGLVGPRVRHGAMRRAMRSRNQTLAALLALAWVVLQPAERSLLLASAWSLGHEEDGHAHSIVLAADAGHFDLVVSHTHDDEGERAGAFGHPEHADHAEHPTSCKAADHVVHLAFDPAARETGRGHASHAVPQRAPTASFAAAEAFAVRAWPAPHAGATELLRTVVLRS